MSPKRIIFKIRGLDLSSSYSFVVGMSSIIISFIVSIITFYKLLEARTHIALALIISIVVFYIFSSFYTFILMIGLKYFRKNEDVL
ncbi:MAG: hypothetical protein M3Q63_02085 [bacterium]|nr:hypothetical protein [bacterium]